MFSKQQMFTLAALAAACQAQQILPELLINSADSAVKELTDAEMPNTSYPGDECCVFWPDGSYRGTPTPSLCLKDGKTTTYLMSDYGMHDKMSSWWCGKSISYDHCNNTSGSCE